MHSISLSAFNNLFLFARPGLLSLRPEPAGQRSASSWYNHLFVYSASGQRLSKLTPAEG